MKLVFILSALILVKVVTAYRVYHLVPVKELRRRARSHDTHAAALYKIAANIQALDVLLYLSGIAAAAVILIITARYAWWVATVAILIIVWLSIWAPQPAVGGLLWRFCAWSAPYLFKLLAWLRPILDFVVRTLPKRELPKHSGAYEKEDLVELLQRQARQADNRIPEDDLKLAAAALHFGDQSVSKVMTPRGKVRFVSEDDIVGPMFMDELHKSGHLRFPVVKGSARANAPIVTGTLYLRDVVEIGQENKGKVKDLMKTGAYFINEACDLRQALDAILKHHHNLLMVVNNFEEVVGVIALEDIIEKLIGATISEDFESYHDMHAVAGLDAKRQKTPLASEPAEASDEAEPEQKAIASDLK